MDALAEAFGALGKALQFNGRRLLRAQLEARTRVYVPEPGNQARRAKMAKRAERRAVIRKLRAKAKAEGKSTDGIFFRPVYGYLGVEAPDHKAVIAAMKASARARK